MNSSSPVRQIQAGQSIQGIYACVRKDRLLSRHGQPYLAVQLRDKTGTIDAKLFSDADRFTGLFESGHLVEVVGRAVQFRDEITLELTSIQSSQAKVEFRDYLPTTYRDLEELNGFIEHLAREVTDEQYSRLLNRLLADQDFREQFQLAPCTPNGHHAYLGGLLEHTVAVTTLAFELCQLHPKLNSDLLLCAAIVHDIGKVNEFTYGAQIQISPQGQLLGHIQLGIELLSKYKGDISQEKWANLANCILCHHGADVIGNRRFIKAEALALYRLNLLDSATKEVLERSKF